MRGALALAAFLTAVASLPAAQNDSAPAPSLVSRTAGNKELWLVSSRHLPAFVDQAHHADAIEFSRYTLDGDWQASDRAQFSAPERRGTPVVILVPGAPASYERVVNTATEVFDQLVPMLPADEAYRFVVWSWPSDRGPGCALRAYRDLSVVAEAQAFYLASFVDDLEQRTAVTLVGYSFGTRTTSAALQLLAGGEAPYNPPFARRFRKPRRLAAILVASAMNCDWLLPESRYGLAMTNVRRILVTVNPADPTLRRYPKLFGLLRHYPKALGSVGISGWTDSIPFGDRYEELNIAPSVGATHDPLIHMSSEDLKKRFRRIVTAVDEQ